MRLLKSLVIGLVLVPSLLYGQGVSTSASYLKVPVSARASALGDGTVADAGQISSWALNPANLFAGVGRSVTISHAQWIQEIQSEFVGLRIPLAKGTAGFALSTSAVPGIEVREKPGPAIGTFTARSASLQIGYATEAFSNLSVGLTAKYMYEKLYVDDAAGYGLDAGILYRMPIADLDLAASVTNLGSLTAYRSERSDLPAFARTGVTYQLEVDEFTARISASFAAGLQNSETHLAGSVEGAYKDFLAIRIGYQTGFESRGISAGFGVTYEFLTFDYGYLPFSYGFGGAHILSLGIEF